MGRHRKETQRVEEKRERERANAAGAATRRVRRFQERLALTRKSKIVKSNFVETFAILSLSLSLSPFSLSVWSCLALTIVPFGDFGVDGLPITGTSRPRGGDQNFPAFSSRSIDSLANSLLLPFDYVLFPATPPPFFFNFYSESRRFTTRFR